MRNIESFFLSKPPHWIYLLGVRLYLLEMTAYQDSDEAAEAYMLGAISKRQREHCYKQANKIIDYVEECQRH